MFIICQDKKSVVNTENIEFIAIGNPLGNNEGKFKILANATSDTQYTLGEYDTEERAEAVFREITNFYEVAKRYEVSSNNAATIFMRNTFSYEMPVV